MRRHGPEALIWRRRIAFLGGAIAIGLIALLFAPSLSASRGLMMPLLGAALMGDFAAQFVSKEKLYHGLAQRFSTVR